MTDSKTYQIDKNMVFETKLTEPDLKFHDIRKEPFDIYGLYNARNEDVFKRLPDDLAKNVNEGVKRLYLHTAGGRVRFTTDSQYIAIKCMMPYVTRMPHMPLSGSSGFDLYVDNDVMSQYKATLMPPVDMKDGYEAIVRFPNRKLRSVTINFPSYNPVSSLYIGLQEDSKLLEGKKYNGVVKKPVLFYGSSITQGGCSSRPGTIYQNVISRHLDIDYLNLGFSGWGRAEQNIIDYMCGLDIGMFVSDYDHNAPNAEYLQNTHCNLYKCIRAAKPDMPYIMLSRPDFQTNREDSIKRRRVIEDTFRYALEQGDTKVYYIDGETIFQGPDEDSCTVDSVHPNDIGFSRMASAIESAILAMARPRNI